LEKFPACRFLVGLEGEEEPEAATLPEPLPLLCFDHQRRRQPPMDGRRLYGPPRSPPPRSDSTQPPHACPGCRRERHGRPARTARHRPPPAMSPRHQPSIGTLDQFPGLVWPEPHRTRRHDHARSTPPSRPECTECVARSRAPAPRLALHCTRTRTASSPRHHDALALHRRAPTRPRHAPFGQQHH
jgi:hypothetical protein